MNGTVKKVAGVLLGIGIVGLVLVLILPSIGVNMFTADTGTPPTTPPTAPTTGATPPPMGCATKVTYLAYAAPKGSNNFGAAVTSTDLATVKKELKSDFCTDPLLFATDKAFANSGLKLDAAKAESRARQYVGSAKAWSSDVDAFFATASDFKLAADNHKYYSIGMVPGSSKNVMPSLVRGQDPVDIGLVLKFKYHGVTRELRLVCHFQPVVPRPFPNVPPTHRTPPPAHHVPPAACVPTPCGTCGSPCVTPTRASQRVPTPAAPTRSVPPTRPRAQPTLPATTTYAPPPGGANGGSTHNPVVSGTPKPVDSGSHTKPIPTPTGGPFG